MQRKTWKKRWFLALVFAALAGWACFDMRSDRSWIHEITTSVLPEPEFKRADEEISKAVADLLATSSSSDESLVESVD